MLNGMDLQFFRMVEIVIGLYYLVFGLNGFLSFIPLPPPSERGLAYLKSLEGVEYLLSTVKGVEIGVGLLWIFGWAGELAWLIFTPIWINIMVYQVGVNRKEFITPLLIFGGHVLLAIKYEKFLATLLNLAFHN